MDPTQKRRPRSSAYGAATTIDQYLERLEPDQRAALETLRRIIRKAAPQAEEAITYGIPAFKQDGVLLGFAASAKHCSIHPMNGHTVADFAPDLAGFSTSTGTIRFTPDKPLPAALVTRIVKARMAENKADAREREAMKAARRKTKRVGALADFLDGSPLRRAGIRVARRQDRPRKSDL